MRNYSSFINYPLRDWKGEVSQWSGDEESFTTCPSDTLTQTHSDDTKQEIENQLTNVNYVYQCCISGIAEEEEEEEGAACVHSLSLSETYELKLSAVRSVYIIDSTTLFL